MNKRRNITRQIGCVFSFVHWIWNNKFEFTRVIFILESLQNCRKPSEPKVWAPFLWEMTTVTIHPILPNPGWTGSQRQVKRHSSHHTYKSNFAFGSHTSSQVTDILQVKFSFFIFLYGNVLVLKEFIVNCCCYWKSGNSLKKCAQTKKIHFIFLQQHLSAVLVGGRTNVCY